jgi:hypothetical protein
MSSYVKHHLKAKIEERKKAQESMLSVTSTFHSKISQSEHTGKPSRDEDNEVPEERDREDFHNLRRLFKGHKISEPHFGNRKGSKGKIRSAVKGKEIERVGKKLVKGAKKVGSSDKGSHKSTPQKFIDFTAYLNQKKKSMKYPSTNLSQNSKVVKKSQKIQKKVPRLAVNSRNNYTTNESITKSNSSLKSSKTRKKQTQLSKQKETMDKILNKYDFRTNNAVNKHRKVKDYKTPRVVD